MNRIARLSFASLVLLASAPVWAAPASELVFPQQTVLWISVPDTPDFQEKFQQTQLGQLAQDDQLAPFCQQLRKQAMQQFGDLQGQLGVSLDDVLAATGGELAMGVLHPTGSPASNLIVLDPTGKAEQAQRLVDLIHVEMQQRQAQHQTVNLNGVEATVYTPADKADRKVTLQKLVRFEAEGRLCFAEGVPTAQAALAALRNASGANLAKSPAFAATMQRCQTAHASAPDLRWFLDPFAYDLAQRSRMTDAAPAGKQDTITLLREQGFDAVRGIGGHVQVKVDASKDFVHRTAVYAPPKPGTEGRPASEKYELGMRMAQTPNRASLPLESWAPRSTANYTTFIIDVQNAFDNLETVFDALSDYQGAFKNTLEGFERDPYGPKIKFREEIIANLGNRVTRMADYQLPVSTDCERFLFVIDATNPEALRKPIDKWMENDGALQRTLRGVDFWEIVPEEEEAVAAKLGGGLIPLDEEAAEIEDESLLRRAAVCVHDDKLIIASDVEFLEQVLFGVDPHEQLQNTYDYQAAMRELAALVTDPMRCSWSFTRSDESVRPTYELLRQGKLPEGQTFFARLMNKLLTTSEDLERGIVRNQRINGNDLPSFECARRYFGPTARAIKAEEDGWFITGVILNKAGGERVAKRQ